MSRGEITINSIDIESQIGESETLLDQIRTMVRQNKLATPVTMAITIIALAAIFAPLVTSYNPYARTLTDRLQASSVTHILGTDELGKDVFSRIIHGARVSLMVGLVPTVISMAIRTILGLLAGFHGDRTDFTTVCLADVTLAFPSLLLTMVITYIIGGGPVSIFMALILMNWAGTARIVRSQTPLLRGAEYVEATRSIGVREWKIMFQYVLPNYLPSLIILSVLNTLAAILTESSLSLLGVGLQPPSANWGLVVVRGRKYLFSEPRFSIASSVATMIVVATFNFLGDRLRDAFDPYLREQ